MSDLRSDLIDRHADFMVGNCLEDVIATLNVDMMYIGS
jgi:hypothetical protein